MGNCESGNKWRISIAWNRPFHHGDLSFSLSLNDKEIKAIGVICIFLSKCHSILQPENWYDDVYKQS